MKKRLIALSVVIAVMMGLTACANSDMPAARTEEQIAEFTGKITFDIPEEFTTTEEADGATYYLHDEHPDVESNISLTISENDDSFKFISAKRYANEIAKGLRNAYSKRATSKIIEEKYLEIDGRRVLMFQVDYKVADQEITQIYYIIENDAEIITIIFTERNAEGHLDTFKETAESIRFE